MVDNTPHFYLKQKLRECQGYHYEFGESGSGGHVLLGIRGSEASSHRHWPYPHLSRLEWGWGCRLVGNGTAARTYYSRHQYWQLEQLQITWTFNRTYPQIRGNPKRSVPDVCLLLALKVSAIWREILFWFGPFCEIAADDGHCHWRELAAVGGTLSPGDRLNVITYVSLKKHCLICNINRDDIHW